MSHSVQFGKFGFSFNSDLSGDVVIWREDIVGEGYPIPGDVLKKFANYIISNELQSVTEDLDVFALIERIKS